jgi:hypothetical protein
MLKRLILLCLSLVSLLSASVVNYLEHTATANALNGITLLSDSVADYAISPTIGQTGVATFYNRPFNMSEIAILGFATAASRNRFIFAGGSTYLHHSDYSWHNPFLSGSYHYYGIALGVSGHMVYDSVKDEDSEYDFSYDLGAKYSHKDYAAELKYLRVGSADEQLVISMKASLSEGVYTATSYVYETGGKDYFRAGIQTEINQYLSVYGSWQNEPNRFGLGARLGIEPWSLMYSLRTHPQLDVSHALALQRDW